MNFKKDSARTLKNEKNIQPPTSLYNLNFLSNTKKEMNLESLRGKKLLIVNTASACGFTPQFEELQKLQDRFADQLTVIGFPSNDFKEQEKLNDEEIASFCQINYGISFPLASKTTVVKGDTQNPVYAWLSSKEKNGWNEQEPKWNFCKYLINEKGELTHYFDVAVSPLDDEIVNAINSGTS